MGSTSYRTNAVSVRVVQHYSNRFDSGNFDVKDELNSGQPVTDKVNAILEKIEQDRHGVFINYVRRLGKLGLISKAKAKLYIGQDEIMHEEWDRDHDGHNVISQYKRGSFMHTMSIRAKPAA
ncbi:hypothetical protein EVAR_33952_1 [Eumeta japonica]|uniref:Uncharacterized protein n=1 Tax=Eumeta variegata TaxID=151549 RepID=A0A4C1VZT3_EUMVA|nr:hypothetical protein EVAR_33952_1 [Eumeta japonica]